VWKQHSIRAFQKKAYDTKLGAGPRISVSAKPQWIRRDKGAEGPGGPEKLKQDGCDGAGPWGLFWESTGKSSLGSLKEGGRSPGDGPQLLKKLSKGVAIPKRGIKGLVTFTAKKGGEQSPQSVKVSHQRTSRLTMASLARGNERALFLYRVSNNFKMKEGSAKTFNLHLANPVTEEKDQCSINKK